VVAWLIRVASRKLRGSNREMQETTGRLTGMVEETLGGVREIKLFGTHDHEDRRFAEVAERCASRPCAPCGCRRSTCPWCRCWPRRRWPR
jgi:ABC-type multidrug transport system fused ATPase/permease subunit